MLNRGWTTLGCILASGVVCAILTVGGCPPGTTITINTPDGNDAQAGEGDPNAPGANREGRGRTELKRLEECAAGNVQLLPQANAYLSVEHQFEVEVVDSTSPALEALLNPECEQDAAQDEADQRQVIFEMGQGGLVRAVHQLFRGFDGRQLFTTRERTGGLRFVIFEGCLELVGSRHFDERVEQERIDELDFDPNDPNVFVDPNEFDPNDFDPNEIFDPNDPNAAFDLESPIGDPADLFSVNESLICGENATELRGGDPNDPNDLGADAGICVSVETVGYCRECDFTGTAWVEVYSVQITWSALEGGSLVTPCGQTVIISEGDRVTADLKFETRYTLGQSPQALGFVEAEIIRGGFFDPNAFGDPNNFDPNLFDPNLYDPNDPNSFDPNVFYDDPNELFDEPNDFDFDANSFGF